jgi:cytochrome c553
VATLVSNSCKSCHGSPLAGGAPVQLLTRADFMAASARDATKSYGERSVIRMRDAASPMPSSGLLPAAEVDAFDLWVTGGMQEGSCAPVGPPPQTCASGTILPASDNVNPQESMYPGQACAACHGSIGGFDPPPVYRYMGTVFAAPHEKDRCAPALGITATVEILQVDGGVFTRLPVTDGNFMGSGLGAAPAQYRARVVTSQGAREMVGAQTNGDCNTCHTADGNSGAPGRIYLP